MSRRRKRKCACQSAGVEANSMAVLRRLCFARRTRTHAVTTVDSLVAFVSDSKFRISSCTQECVATPAQLQHRLGSVEKSGRANDVGGCKSGLDYPLVWSAFSPPRRDCHAVSAQFFSALGRGFNEGSRRPLDGLRSRLLATKAKKSKGKVENVGSIEDTAGTAKGNALRLMETALDVLSREHSKLRTGRAAAGMLDHITVEAHGVRTPLNHIAAVTVSGLQTLNVLPYDASMVKEVEKAILNSPMGLNPQVDGATMTVPLPRLTKEHCETMCKLVSKAGESAKLTIRRARKEALDMVKSSGDLSKDEMKRFEKEVEELTKKYTKSIDETCKNKEKEIMA